MLLVLVFDKSTLLVDFACWLLIHCLLYCLFLLQFPVLVVILFWLCWFCCEQNTYFKIYSTVSLWLYYFSSDFLIETNKYEALVNTCLLVALIILISCDAFYNWVWQLLCCDEHFLSFPSLYYELNKILFWDFAVGYPRHVIEFWPFFIKTR